MIYYQMPVLTEHEKEDLLAECRRMINDAMKRGASYRQVAQMKLAKIALAALTAKPVDPADCFQPVYLAPPVPVKQEGEQ